jgi:hypothetical protein
MEADEVRATFRGTAKVNAIAGYSFIVWVEDHDHPGPGGDKFRVQILGPESFLYDSLTYATNGGLLDWGNIHARRR